MDVVLEELASGFYRVCVAGERRGFLDFDQREQRWGVQPTGVCTADTRERATDLLLMLCLIADAHGDYDAAIAALTALRDRRAGEPEGA